MVCFKVIEEWKKFIEEVFQEQKLVGLENRWWQGVGREDFKKSFLVIIRF